jgi:hypothetical protein
VLTAIPTHPSRRERWPYLEGALPGCRLLADPGLDLVRNSLTALETLAAGGDRWGLYAQDDIEVAPDLAAHWDVLLAGAPVDATALALFDPLPWPDAPRPSWIALPEGRLLWVQAVLLRTDALPAMIRFIAEETARAPVALRASGFDVRLTAFLRARGRAYLHAPSLVQHLDLPSVSGHALVPGFPRRSATFAEGRRVADLYPAPGA